MILAHRKCIPSCKLLRDEIKKITGIHLIITSDVSKIKHRRLHIRWGNSDPVEGKKTNFNNRESIIISSNKIKFSKELNDNGLYSPILTRFSSKIPKEEDYPIIIRTALQGKSGEGIVGVFERKQDIPAISGYWTKFYRLSWELRLHIFKGEIFRVFSKRPFEGTNEKFPIRNNENYHFSLIDHKRAFKEGKYSTLISKVEKIYDILGANFFVLDCGWCPELDNYLFLESGTAPGLNRNSALEYAERLVEEAL